MRKFRCIIACVIISIAYVIGQFSLSFPVGVSDQHDQFHSTQWKTVQTKRVQFRCPSSFQVQVWEPENEEEVPSQINLLAPTEILQIEINPAQDDFALESLDNNQSLLVRYDFDGETCHRHCEIYSGINFKTRSGLECRELKIKKIVDCHPENVCRPGEVTEYYDVPSIFAGRFTRNGKAGCVYVIPDLGARRIPNDILWEIVQSIQISIP
ncbi:MAG TPA: hypothetical protein PKZ53_23990, partial [Acidobacteriota bacterium]|nr:hypothetical protein [Acidobacteriota bacterium]